MAKLFELYADIKCDLADFKNGINKAESYAKSAAKNIKTHLKDAGEVRADTSKLKSDLKGAQSDAKTAMSKLKSTLGKKLKLGGVDTSSLSSISKSGGGISGMGSTALSGLAGAGGAALAGAGAAATAGIAAIGAGVAALNGVAESTRELRTSLGYVTTAFQANELSTDDASAALKGFYTLTGDMDQAKEASQLLAGLAKNSEDVAKWVDISAGIMGEYSGALPVESLVEAARETAKVGTVTGSFADALNWANMSADQWEQALSGNTAAMQAFHIAVSQGATVEDAFNTALAAAGDESARTQLITEALTNAYGDSTKAFYENNDALVKQRQAQYDTQAAMSKLGEAVDKVKTSLATGFAPLIETLSGKLADVLNSEGTQNFINKLVEGVNAAAPVVEGFVGRIFDVFNRLSPFFDGVVGGITDAVTIVGNYLGSLGESGFLDSLINSLNESGPVIRDILRNIVDLIFSMQSALTDSGKTQGSIFEMLPGLLSGINTAIEFLMPILTTAAGIIGSVLSGLINGVKGFFDGLAPSLQPASDGLFQIRDALLPVFNTLKNVVDTIMPYLVPVMTTLGQILGAVIVPVIQFIAGLIERIAPVLQFIVNVVGALAGVALQFLAFTLQTLASTVIPAIISAFEYFADTLLQFVEDIIKWFAEDLPNGFASFVNWLSGLPQAIADAVSGLYNTMMQLGSDIISGIGDGLQAGWQWVQDFVSAIINWVATKISRVGDVFAAIFSGGDVLGAISDLFTADDFNMPTRSVDYGDSALGGVQNSLNQANRNSNTPGSIVVQSVLDGRVIGQSAYDFNRQQSRALGV